MSSETYVRQAVADVETELEKVDQCLPTHVMTPVSQGYCPECDQLPELDSKRGQYYQSLIGAALGLRAWTTRHLVGCCLYAVVICCVAP
jgi:hypothetical protein